MIVCTTIVLFILVETTWPILVLRLLVFCACVVSAIYFFLFLAVAAVFFFAVLPLAVLPLALLPEAACFFGPGALSAATASAPACALAASGAAMPRSFSRITV